MPRISCIYSLHQRLTSVLEGKVQFAKFVDDVKIWRWSSVITKLFILNCKMGNEMAKGYFS